MAHAHKWFLASAVLALIPHLSSAQIVPTCTRSDSLDPGASYAALTVTVSVASNAISPQTNTAIVGAPGLLDVFASDPTVVTSQPCDVKVPDLSPSATRNPSSTKLWDSAPPWRDQ
jgi:hypothetical protein